MKATITVIYKLKEYLKVRKSTTIGIPVPGIMIEDIDMIAIEKDGVSMDFTGEEILQLKELLNRMNLKTEEEK